MESRKLAHGISVAVIAVSYFAAGCARNDGSAPRPLLSEQVPVSGVRTTAALLPAVDQGIVLSEDLLRGCKIELANIQAAPKFDFDQADVRVADRPTLEQIARCVTTGPLHGRALELVGRADPRGEQEYNLALGSSRAESVARYLESLGVPGGQLVETSRGNLDATGTDEASWQIDRRVDLGLR